MSFYLCRPQHFHSSSKELEKLYKIWEPFLEASEALDRQLKVKGKEQARTERQGQSLLCVQCGQPTQILMIDFLSDV